MQIINNLATWYKENKEALDQIYYLYKKDCEQKNFTPSPKKEWLQNKYNKIFEI